jgi:hypothetical protein
MNEISAVADQTATLAGSGQEGLTLRAGTMGGVMDAAWLHQRQVWPEGRAVRPSTRAVSVESHQAASRRYTDGLGAARHLQFFEEMSEVALDRAL